jgi:RNA polymerase sigma-70 factor (ECF subfamily)
MDRHDFSQQVEGEIPHLQRYAYALTGDAAHAQDLVQDCLERALVHSGKFTAGTNLRAWLFTILRNLNIDHQRRRVRRGVHLPLEDWEGEFRQPPRQEDHLALRELERRLADLKGSDRDILWMSVFDGRSHAEIADRMGVAVGTVKSRLSRARQSLAA